MRGAIRVALVLMLAGPALVTAKDVVVPVEKDAPVALAAREKDGAKVRTCRRTLWSRLQSQASRVSSAECRQAVSARRQIRKLLRKPIFNGERQVIGHMAFFDDKEMKEEDISWTRLFHLHGAPLSK